MPDYQSDQFRPRPRRGRLFARSLSLLVLLAGFFALGVLVGRGDINVQRLSQSSSAKTSAAFDYSSVDQVYKLLKKDFDGSLNQSQLLDGIKSGLVSAAGDPYTQFFNPKEAKEFSEALSGSFTGIGAELGTNSDNNIVIVSPLAGYPAEKAGLKPKDIVAAVDGQTTSGMRVDAVVHKIRGPANSKVTLTIVRGNAKPFDVTITRVQIKVPSVKYQVDGVFGYLKISQFTEDTVGLAQKAAADFKSKQVKGIVLDLRGNPGGYLDSAVAISSLWLADGKTVVSERSGSSIIDTKYASGASPFKGLPTVVLIDGGSASASEITAGALRDNGAATLVGNKSFGKGSVQEVEELAGGSKLKVTIARWYTPAGKNIDKQGIPPDIKVEAPNVDQKTGKDSAKDKAYAILRGKI